MKLKTGKQIEIEITNSGYCVNKNVYETLEAMLMGEQEGF